MRLLYTTDGSDSSIAGAEFLKRFAFRSEDQITFTHVINLFPFNREASIAYTHIEKIKQELAPQILDVTIEALGPVKARISTAILSGYPGDAIIEAVKEHDCDLVVMGTRGLKGIKSFLLGSTARTVTINSQVPVLVIHPVVQQDEEKLKILLAADGSYESEQVMNLLKRLPLPDDTEVTIINVVVPAISDIPPQYMTEINEKLIDIIEQTQAMHRTESEKLLQKAQECLNSKFKFIQLVTRFGDPSLEILDAAKVFKADMIAIGSRGLRGLKGMLGSVSRNILGHAECSVLIWKGETEKGT